MLTRMGPPLGISSVADTRSGETAAAGERVASPIGSVAMPRIGGGVGGAAGVTGESPQAVSTLKAPRNEQSRHHDVRISSSHGSRRGTGDNVDSFCSHRGLPARYVPPLLHEVDVLYSLQ